MINDTLLSIHENVKAFLDKSLTSVVRNLVHYITVFAPRIVDRRTSQSSVDHLHSYIEFASR